MRVITKFVDVSAASVGLCKLEDYEPFTSASSITM